MKKHLLFFAMFCTVFVPVLAYAQVQVLPFVNSHQQFFNGGSPCNGCQLFTYSAGTTTPLATYSDSLGTVLNTNPVVLASDGSATIYLQLASYKFVLQTAGGASIWTQDGVTANNIASTLASLTISGVGPVTINTATAATGGANQSGPVTKFCGKYWNGAASADDCWSLQDVLGTGTNPTTTLQLTHSGSSGAAVASIPAANVNGMINAAAETGTTLDAKLNKCITDAQAQNPHICDARNVGNGTIAAQVDVGDNATATPVTLLLPTKATWTVTVTGGTACGIMVHNKGNMLGDPAGQGIGMVIAAGATANVDSLVCTDPAPIGGGSYVHIGGFLVQSALGGTVVTAALNIQQTFDNSLIERVTANCQGCVGVYTHNLCCGLVMRGIQSEGSNATGSKPCVIGNTGENTSSIHFADEFNCVHPGNGNAAMIVQGTTTWTQLISWDSIYIEPNQADITTALASFTGSNGPFLIGQIRAGNFGVGPNNYLIDAAAAVHGFTVLQAIVPPSGNIINDHVHGVTITGTSNQTFGPYGWGDVGSQIYQTKLTVANHADAALNNTINCGATATQTCTLDFQDQGVNKYSIQKDGTNQFILFNSATAAFQLLYNAAGAAVYNVPTGQTHAFRVNNSPVAILGGTGFTSYNGVATADYGVSAIQGTPQHLTGQVGNLGATNLYAAAPPAGVYRVCFDAFTTTSGTGTTMTVSIGWTDAGGAKTFTSATWALNSVTITGYVDGCKIINSSGAANITVSTTGTIGTSAYAIDAMAERMK